MNYLSAGTNKWPLYRGSCCAELTVSGGSTVSNLKLQFLDSTHFQCKTSVQTFIPRQLFALNVKTIFFSCDTEKYRHNLISKCLTNNIPLIFNKWFPPIFRLKVI